MFKKLLFVLFFILSLNISAQNTYVIEWTFGSNSNVNPADSPRNADRTIEVGDTVRWEFVDNGSHNVVSQAGATESFDSGTVQAAGFTFEHTFNQIGTNPYICEPHPGSMFGTIEVVAQGTLSLTQAFQDLKFSIKPNPSSNFLNINLESVQLNDYQLEVYDVLGKRVYQRLLSRVQSSVDVSNWKSGVYLVKVFNDQQSQTKRFLKQ